MNRKIEFVPSMQEMPVDVDASSQSVISQKMVDQLTFRDGMAQLATAVHVITTDGLAGQAGFTASAVCSVTDSPPTLLVCLNRSASVFEIFKRNQVLCVNTLAMHHISLSNAFGGKTPMLQRFLLANWSKLITQSPVLEDAVIAFDCDVVQSMSIGTHDVLICQVKAIKPNKNSKALLYFNRSYCGSQPIS